MTPRHPSGSKTDLRGTDDSDGWADDIASLYILESFTVPLPTELPSQRRERERIYRGSGQVTREMIARLLAGEFR